jgi:VIT1/CCC1 family predicted Fe2+/Mn2+ transporter
MLLPAEFSAANAEKYRRAEHTDHILYAELARTEKDPSRRDLLKQLSSKEEDHYEFWNRLSPGKTPTISRFYLRLILLARTLFGLTFTLKLLERREEKTIKEYKELIPTFPENEKPYLESMIRDEEEHESGFIAQLNERVVSYMSFIVLGLADAIVEITGVHAGFLGVTSSTLIAGIAGMVVGFAAAISMASAAYLQAKSDLTRSPNISALTTGTAYLSAVVLLALPYFLTKNMLYAFGSSVIVAILLVASFTLYGSVLNEKSFKKEFGLTTALTLGTALGTFLFGDFIGRLFGVQQYAGT